MKAVHDKIEGPFAIEEDLALYGMVIGSATLRSGIKLILHGTIAGDLILEPGARATAQSPGVFATRAGEPRYSALLMASKTFPRTP